MAGRIGIDDVAPVVSAGRYPAKAVVGEVVPVQATVWREGHDAVAATLVVRFHGTDYPQLADGPAQDRSAQPVPIETVVTPASRIKPQAIPMSTGSAPDVLHGQFCPDRVGLWTFRVDAWGDPIATWRRAVTAKLDVGQSESELSNDLSSVLGCWSGPPPACRERYGIRSSKPRSCFASRATRSPAPARHCPRRSASCLRSIRCGTR